MKSMVEGKVCSCEFNLGNIRDKLLSYGWYSVGRKTAENCSKIYAKILTIKNYFISNILFS
jgi:hypothetical protein